MKWIDSDHFPYCHFDDHPCHPRLITIPLIFPYQITTLLFSCPIIPHPIGLSESLRLLPPPPAARVRFGPNPPHLDTHDASPGTLFVHSSSHLITALIESLHLTPLAPDCPPSSTTPRGVVVTAAAARAHPQILPILSMRGQDKGSAKGSDQGLDKG